MSRHASFALLLALVTATLASANAVTVRGREFVGPDGRPLLLRGLNVSNNAKFKPYMPWQTADDIALMRDWGCNCLRYIIVWAAIEPEPGRYDDNYLEAVRQRLDWARAAGQYVLLDMHQDVYGEKYGFCGAPTWATVDGGVAFQQDPTRFWGASYLQPAVMQAFEGFWRNAPAPDGVGVQDHLIRAWVHVAQVLGDHPAVIGYDLLNEPFYGNILTDPDAIKAVLRAQQKLPRGMQLSDMFSAARKPEAQAFVTEPAQLYSAIDCADPFFRKFETGKLMPYYERVIPELLKVTPDKIFFLEPHIWASGGGHSFLERPKAAGAGVQIAYAPHYYDPACSPTVPYDGNPGRAREAFRRMAEVADRLGGPVFLGEWGDAESPASTAVRYVGDEGALMREFGFSDCYYEYSPDFAQRPVLDVLRKTWAGNP
jgi:endoglycosylceramidase